VFQDARKGRPQVLVPPLSGQNGYAAKAASLSISVILGGLGSFFVTSFRAPAML
jgi:hypothetical protein